MMILKKQPKSLLDEYHDLEAKIGQTKKILTHLNYLKHSSLQKKQASFRERMIKEQCNIYEAEVSYLLELKKSLKDYER